MKFASLVVAAVLAVSPSSHAFTLSTQQQHRRILSSTTTQLQAEITMPALSSTMKEGRVVSWLKSEGDEIEAGEAIMVVESDKADMDVEAFEDGVLAKIIVEEGDLAPVGQAVALVAESAADVDSVIADWGGAVGSTPVPVTPTEGKQR